MGHSVRYLAEKMRRKEALNSAKRKAEEAERAAGEREARKKVSVDEQERLKTKVTQLMGRAVGVLEKQMNEVTEGVWKDVYGDRWEEGMRFEKDRLRVLQEDKKREEERLEAERKKIREREMVDLKRDDVFG